MLSVQMSYVISSLLLPVLMLTFNHPNRFVKWAVRGTLLGLSFYLIAVVPFLILSELKYWSLLIVLIPIIFRVASLILDKIGFFSSENAKIVGNLVYASVAALSVIFVSASSNTLEKFFFLIIILIVLYVSDFQIIEKYKPMAALFGPIIAVIPSFESFNIFFTVVAVWLVMTISLDILLRTFKIKKSEHITKTTLIVFVTISIIIANNGGLQFNWAIVFLKIVSLITISCLLLGSSFLINEKIKNIYAKQFLPVIISNGFIGLLLLIISKYDGVKLFFSSILIFVVVLCVFVGLNRLISPLDKLTDSKSFPFKMSNINEMMTLIFGKKLGRAIFNNLFGVSYEAIHIGIALPFFLFYIGTGGYLLHLQLGMSILFSKDQTLSFVTASSMFSALILISELIRVFGNPQKGKGLDSNDALHSSTLITLEYFFIFMPLLYINIKNLENINNSFIVIGCLFLLLFFINVNMFLYLDLKKPYYNNFKRIRLVLSGLLQAVAITGPLVLFFLEYRDSGLFFINHYNKIAFFIGFLAMFPAKLLGYDTEFGSKKAYKRSWLKLTFFFISSNLFSYTLPILIYLLIGNKSLAVYISVLLLVLFIAAIGAELAMVMLPWSNTTDKSINRQWSDMLKRLKAESEIKTDEINHSKIIKKSIKCK